MRIIKIAFVLIVSMALTNNGIGQSEKKEQLIVPLSNPGKSFKLNVHLINGYIKVVSYEGKEVLIDVETVSDKKNADRKEKNSGMKRIVTANNMEFSAVEKNNHITVRTDSWTRPVNLTIKVPQGEAMLNLSAENNGDIQVNNVSGQFEISNANGSILLTNISGSVVANTLNGHIAVSFKNVDPKATMAFSTLNGNIDITFPATFKANMKLKSDFGVIFTDFDMEGDKSQIKENKDKPSGLYRINTKNWVYGKINGGGPEMMMKNMVGDIYIRKVK